MELPAPRSTTRTRKRTMSTNNPPNPYDDLKATATDNDNFNKDTGGGGADIDFLGLSTKTDESNNFAGAKPTPRGPSVSGGFDFFSKDADTFGGDFNNEKTDFSDPFGMFGDNGAAGNKDATKPPEDDMTDPFGFFGSGGAGAGAGGGLTVPAQKKHGRQASAPPDLQHFDPNFGFGQRGSSPDEDEDDEDDEDESGTEEESESDYSEDDEALNMQQSDEPKPKSKPKPKSGLSAPKHEHRRGVSVDQGTKQMQVTIEEKDALKEMKKGTSFLKYGKMGYPHFRPFHLSEDNESIVWYSKNKSKGSTQIKIKDIDQIVSGQKTRTFSRHRAPELARSSFSIIYDNQKKSLDVVAKSPQEHAIWVQGLETLREAARTNQHNELKELIVRLKTTKSVKKNGDRKNTRPKYSAQKALKELQSLQRMWHRFEDQLNQPKIISSPDYEPASEILERIRESLYKAAINIRDGDLHEIDYKLWQIAVEVESLDNMMTVIAR